MSIYNKAHCYAGEFLGTLSGTVYTLDGVADCMPIGTLTTDAVDFSDFRNIGVLVTCNNVTTAIEGKYQVSFDNSAWIDGAGTVLALDNNEQHVVPSENPIRYLRLWLANGMEAETATVKAFWFAKS